MSTARMPGRRSHAIEPLSSLLTEAERRAEIKARLAAVKAEHRVGRIEARVYVLVVVAAVVASAFWPDRWF